MRNAAIVVGIRAIIYPSGLSGNKTPSNSKWMYYLIRFRCPTSCQCERARDSAYSIFPKTIVRNSPVPCRLFRTHLLRRAVVACNSNLNYIHKHTSARTISRVAGQNDGLLSMRFALSVTSSTSSTSSGWGGGSWAKVFNSVGYGKHTTPRLHAKENTI